MSIYFDNYIDEEGEVDEKLTLNSNGFACLCLVGLVEIPILNFYRNFHIKFSIKLYIKFNGNLYINLYRNVYTNFYINFYRIV